MRLTAVCEHLPNLLKSLDTTTKNRILDTFKSQGIRFNVDERVYKIHITVIKGHLYVLLLFLILKTSQTLLSDKEMYWYAGTKPEFDVGGGGGGAHTCNRSR